MKRSNEPTNEITDELPPELTVDAKPKKKKGATLGDTAHEALAAVGAIATGPEQPIPTPQDVGEVLVSELQESPTNPRRTFGDLADLVESVRRFGVLQPLLIRAVDTPEGGKRMQVVFGHRRLRAAQKAGLLKVPCRMSELSDEQVLEAQLVENCQRADIHPMEEAEGYERLIKQHGRTAEEIAHRVGKSKAYVYGRLKLCELEEFGRMAFYAGRLNASTALLVARVPGAALQEQATKEIAPEEKDPLSYRAAAEHIQTRYMLRLADAPFNPKDEFLVPEAGPCATCPKRAGNNPDLFGDVAKADTCTDPACFQKKVAAHVDAKLKKAEAKGQVALTPADGKRLFKHGTLGWDERYVELRAVCPEDPKKRSWKEMLGEDVPQVYVVPDPQGRIHELILKEQAAEVLAGAGTKAAKKAAEALSQTAGKERAAAPAVDEREAEIDHAATEEREKNVLQALVGHVTKHGLTEAHVARLVALAVLDVLDPREVVLKRHGWADTAAARKAVEKEQDPKAIAAVIAEVVTADWILLGESAASGGTEAKVICKTIGADYRKIDREARAWAEAQVIAEEGAKQAAKESAIAATHTCSGKGCLKAIPAEEKFCADCTPKAKAKKGGKA